MIDYNKTVGIAYECFNRVTIADRQRHGIAGSCEIQDFSNTDTLATTQELLYRPLIQPLNLANLYHGEKSSCGLGFRIMKSSPSIY